MKEKKKIIDLLHKHQRDKKRMPDDASYDERVTGRNESLRGTQMNCIFVLVVVLSVAAVVVALVCLIWRRSDRAASHLNDLSGARVVVVGNASFHGLGKIIDGFDVVVRVNPLDPLSTKDRGRKTDIVHINHNIPVKSLRHVPRVHHYWTRNEDETRAQIDKLGVKSARIETYDFRAFRDENIREYMTCPYGKNMTSGMLAVLHALQRVGRVYTAGIGAYTATGREERKNAEAFHRQNLDKFHCIDAERALLARLVEEERVVPLDGAA